jgi:glycosyltransferase 2 family protein
VTASRLLRLAVAVLLTAYILWKANPAAVVRAAAAAEPAWIALAVALVFVDRVLMAYRWMLLLCALSPGSRPPLTRVMRVFFVSTFVGTFLPSIGGDVYRAYRLAQLNVAPAESAASVLMDRVLGVLSIVVVGTAALLVMRDLELPDGVVASLAAAAICCAIAAAAVFSERVASAVVAAAERVPSHRVHGVARAATDAIRRYAQHHGELLSVLVMSVVVQIIRVVQAYCLGRALAIDLPFAAYFAFIPVILLVMLLPITINGLGTSQYAFEWLFGRVGVAAPQAVALSILFVALGLIGNLPGGLLYATEERRPSRTTSGGSARRRRRLLSYKWNR